MRLVGISQTGRWYFKKKEKPVFEDLGHRLRRQGLIADAPPEEVIDRTKPHSAPAAPTECTEDDTETVEIHAYAIPPPVIVEPPPVISEEERALLELEAFCGPAPKVA